MPCIHVQQKHMHYHLAFCGTFSNQGVALYSCREWATDCLSLKEISLIITKWQHGGKKKNRRKDVLSVAR